MGLFGFIGKALGGVAKLAGGVLLGAANQATGGVAGKALGAVKSLVAGKPKAATVAVQEDQPATLKQVASLNKLAPKVQRTEYSVAGSRKEGWGFGPSQKAGAKKKPRSAAARELARHVRAINAENRAEALTDVGRKRSKRRSKASKRGKPRRGGLRSGMLDLAAMAAAWKAAGKPGSWQSWIKTNPQRVP